MEGGETYSKVSNIVMLQLTGTSDLVLQPQVKSYPHRIMLLLLLVCQQKKKWTHFFTPGFSIQSHNSFAKVNYSISIFQVE